MIQKKIITETFQFQKEKTIVKISIFDPFLAYQTTSNCRTLLCLSPIMIMNIKYNAIMEDIYTNFNSGYIQCSISYDSILKSIEVICKKYKGIRIITPNKYKLNKKVTVLK